MRAGIPRSPWRPVPVAARLEYNWCSGRGSATRTRRAYSPTERRPVGRGYFFAGVARMRLRETRAAPLRRVRDLSPPSERQAFAPECHLCGGIGIRKNNSLQARSQQGPRMGDALLPARARGPGKALFSLAEVTSFAGAPMSCAGIEVGRACRVVPRRWMAICGSPEVPCGQDQGHAVGG